MRILLVHGWGFGPWIWNGMMDRLTALMSPLDLEVVPLELGFFGPPTPPQNGHFDVAVGHSLGFLWLLENRLITFDRLVSINGFTRFSRADDFPTGWPGRVVQRMRKQLAVDAESMLAEFMSKSGVEAEFRKHTDWAAVDIAKLDWALEALINRDGREQWSQFEGPTRAIAGTLDEIVTPGQTRACFFESDVQWLKSNSHCLPLKFPEICAALVRELIEVT